MLRAWGTRDIVIRHHWWSDVPLRLNAYKHRGYWFKGKQRERRVMEKLAELAKPEIRLSKSAPISAIFQFT
ncbi:hypothetical protein AJ87_42710 [Rhizobium yanglingense]|nr:hypothetical protein AJ87_42710 [Rhizobium yanglingense]